MPPQNLFESDILRHCALPPRTPERSLHPGLILLHARGDDEMTILDYAESLDPRLFLISVRGPFAHRAGYEWCNLSQFGKPEPLTFEYATSCLSRFITWAITAYHLDPSRVYMLGFSQGGMMAGALHLSYPQSVAGSIILLGYLPFGLVPRKDQRSADGCDIYMANGTDDQTVPLFVARASRAYLSKLGANVTYREHPVGHQVTLEVLRGANRWLSQRIDRVAGTRPDAKQSPT